ncbi:trehalose operon repressor TreR [Tatumella sp. UCD-D_suzukii]|uniref:trehalose operon repressor TreR n=1 Tax=Tatumella sp. UCD-D_suzukii TaxID=1408192 RepID=UPI000471D58B|nr:trehalose operon repressor TreR [Tatumella sp. UCD-D_suzukii]
MPKRLTIKDIARLSGTGKSTVSRVLNQQGDVHPETRKRIEAVINEYQFTPSRPARSMRVKESRVIGIIMARLDSAAENQAVSAMLPLLYRHGYDVLILESRFSTDKVTEHLTVLKQREVDGAILFSFTGLTAGMIAGWEPHMVLMVHPCDGFSSVCYDDAGAVQMLADHLFQQGHRRISYLGVNQSDKTTGEDRYLAYLTACKRLSLTPHASLGTLEYHSGYTLAGEVCGEGITAVICATDSLALGVYKYLGEHPAQQITVAAIGNTPLLGFLFPAVITLEFGYANAGELAARQLLAHLSHSAPARTYLLNGQLNTEIAG